MISSRPNLIVAVLFVALTGVLCDVDLIIILKGAADKYAWDHSTDIDTSTLAGGFCFSSTDLGQGPESCSSQSMGAWLGYGKPTVVKSYITKRSHIPHVYEVKAGLEVPIAIHDFNLTDFKTTVSLAERATFTEEVSVEVDLKILDEADFPLVFGRKGINIINTLDTSSHESLTRDVTESQETPLEHTACVVRTSERMETDTEFIIEYTIPIHGNILVAFKDEVSIPGQEGTGRIKSIPVATLLSRAKAGGEAKAFDVPEIGFPSYHGNINVKDGGALEQISFRSCHGNDDSATVPLVNLENTSQEDTSDGHSYNDVQDGGKEDQYLESEIMMFD